MPMLRDIDYAAKAVKTAIVEKFGRTNALEDLRVFVNEKGSSISVCHRERVATGTRERLLVAVHRADSYEQLWQVFPLANV